MIGSLPVRDPKAANKVPLVVFCDWPCCRVQFYALANAVMVASTME